MGSAAETAGGGLEDYGLFVETTGLDPSIVLEDDAAFQELFNLPAFQVDPLDPWFIPQPTNEESFINPSWLFNTDECSSTDQASPFESIDTVSSLPSPASVQTESSTLWALPSGVLDVAAMSSSGNTNESQLSQPNLPSHPIRFRNIAPAHVALPGSAFQQASGGLQKAKTQAHGQQPNATRRKRPASGMPVSPGHGEVTCPTCAKTYPTSRDLRRHQKCHDPPIQCKFCPKRLPFARELDRHMRVHHPQSSGQLGIPKSDASCSVCGEAFTRKDNMARHLKNKHGISKAS